MKCFGVSVHVVSTLPFGLNSDSGSWSYILLTFEKILETPSNSAKQTRKKPVLVFLAMI